MPTIVVTDCHFGEYSHGFIDRETGLNSRLIDIKRVFEQVLTYAKENAIDRVIVAGDSFDVKNPKNFIRALFADSITDALQNGVHLYIMTGNHDMTQAAGAGHSLSEMEKFAKVIPNLHVISNPTVLNWDDTDFVFFPHVNRGDHGILSRNEIKDWNKKQIKELSDQTENNSIFIGHFSTDASCEIDKQAIEVEFLQSLSFNLILLGHIHKYQQITDKIYHIGSMARTDFHDEGVPKYFAIVDGLDIDFVEIEDREFKTFTLDLSKTLARFKANEQAIMKQDLSETITRLVVTMNESDEGKVDVDSLEAYLRNNSWKFTGMVKNVIQGEMSTEFASSDLTPMQLFEDYANSNAAFFGKDLEYCTTRGMAVLEQLV